MKKPTTVLIIGGGPTGMTLACQLIQQGISCRVIEKRSEQTNESKAINVSSASMQMWDRIGIAPRFLANGKKVKHVYGHWENNRLVHINYNLIESPYQFFLSMPQAKTEQIISEYLTELGGKIERNSEFVELTVVEDGVNAVIKHEDGRIENIQCDYLVACDGAKSSVRTSLNVTFEGHDYHQHYYLLDGYVDWQGPSEDTHYYVTEKGYFIIAPMIGGYHRMVIYDESKGNIPGSHELYQELIDQFGPGKFKLREVLWSSKGFFYNRIIENFRYKQRVFFAGDAAHIFSPLGGHGMNTCLQDVDNLAWKLAGVIKYGWDDRILDTYNEERKLIANKLIIATDFSTRLINKIEKEFTANIVNWFPRLRNRENIRKRYPYQFSGLAQQYNYSEFVQNEKQDGKEEKLVGCYLPYAGNLIGKNKTYNTYQLSRQVPAILFFGQCDQEFLSIIEPYGFQIYAISDEPVEQDHCQLIITLCDTAKGLKNKCRVEDGDFLILRPDGMIGFKGQRSSPDGLRIQLKKWYTPIEKEVECLR